MSGIDPASSLSWPLLSQKMNKRLCAGPTVSLVDYVCCNPLNDESETHEHMFLRIVMVCAHALLMCVLALSLIFSDACFACESYGSVACFL